MQTDHGLRIEFSNVQYIETQASRFLKKSSSVHLDKKPSHCMLSLVWHLKFELCKTTNRTVCADVFIVQRYSLHPHLGGAHVLYH
jgi:hypothetical protein